MTRKKSFSISAILPDFYKNYGSSGIFISCANSALFAAGKPISLQQWDAPQYSSAQTLAMLQQALQETHPTMLPTLTDIDDLASLKQCCSEFNNRDEAQALQQLIPPE